MSRARHAAVRRSREHGPDATLRDWLCEAAETRPRHAALRQGDREWTWSELQSRVAAAGRGLSRLGIKKGDVVAVQLPNIAEFVIAYLAIADCGAVMQTLHMPYRGAELEPLLQHSGARAAVVPTELKDYRGAELLGSLRPRLSALQHVIAVGSPVPGTVSFAELCAEGCHREPSDTCDPRDKSAAGHAAYAPRERGVRTGRARRPEASCTMSGADPFLLLYTSGTTSAPKGVLHPYRNVLGNARSSAAALSISCDDVLVSAAPFTHLYGLFTLNMALAVRATSLLLPLFTPAGMAALFKAGRPTFAFTAPAHIAACLAGGFLDARDLSSLRYVQMSGSAVAPELGRALEARLPVGKVMQLWGMTELQAGAFTRPEDGEAVRLETTGRPGPGTELRVVRDDGGAGAPGEVGELQMRGPSLFSGYLHNAEATRAAFTEDAWFRTGDLASIDAAGNTRLRGRTRDIINRGGVKFNPADVEAVLLRHAAISEAAVVPLPDPVLGERACLCVTVKPGQELTLEAVQAWLASEQVSRIKWPERLEVVDAMPLTATRKIMKSRLIERVMNQRKLI